LIILALCALLVVSCGKGIKPRPLSNNTSRAVKKTASVAKDDMAQNSEELAAQEMVEAEAPAPSTPIDEYGLRFWDSLDLKAFPDPHLNIDSTAHGPRFATASLRKGSQPMQARSRMHAAYRLGIAFASNDPEQVQQRLMLVRMTTPSVVSDDTAAVVSVEVDSLFSQCVARADSDNEHGMAAVMVSGYYFGNLSKVLRNVNPDTQLPDEKTVSMAISRIENLKKYLNQALTSEKDVNTTMLLQDIQARADSITKDYGNLPFASQDKFKELSADISNVDECFD